MAIDECIDDSFAAAIDELALISHEASPGLPSLNTVQPREKDTEDELIAVDNLKRGKIANQHQHCRETQGQPYTCCEEVMKLVVVPLTTLSRSVGAFVTVTVRWSLIARVVFRDTNVLTRTGSTM